MYDTSIIDGGDMTRQSTMMQNQLTRSSVSNRDRTASYGRERSTSFGTSSLQSNNNDDKRNRKIKRRQKKAEMKYILQQFASRTCDHKSMGEPIMKCWAGDVIGK